MSGYGDTKTPKTPLHTENSLETLMGNRLKTPSTSLYATPRYEVSMSSVAKKPSEYATQLLLYWKGRINTTSRDLFLPNVGNVIGKHVVQHLYDDALLIINNIHINNLIIHDVNKMTLSIYNSVLSSMMEDGLKKKQIDAIKGFLSSRSFIYSVLALCFDTAVYLLINNNFNILIHIDTFSIKSCDLQRVLSLFVDKLNQQSSFLVCGDVQNHFTSIMSNIIDYTIWETNSEVWKYLGTNTLKPRFPAFIEVLIRQLIYLAFKHLTDLITLLPINENQKLFLNEHSKQLIKYIIEHNIILFKDRNLTCLIICSIYAISKIFKFDLSFSILLTILSRLYPDNISKVKYNLSLYIDNISIDISKSKGTIIEFYNMIFVVVNNEYLINIKKNFENSSLCIPITSFIEKNSDSIQQNIIDEANQIISNMCKEIDNNQITTNVTLLSNNSILNDDPKSLYNTEEQVTNMLTKMASMSPSRVSVPILPQSAPRPIPSFSPCSSPSIGTVGTRTSYNIVLEHQYGHSINVKRVSQGQRPLFSVVSLNGKDEVIKKVEGVELSSSDSESSKRMKMDILSK